MTSTLIQFGVVMVVVIVGFAMAFYVLFRDFDSFGETLLDLFKAMLGDVEFFAIFAGDPYDLVGTVLLGVYLFIVSIMLLNLLVAVLSTSHAQVQDNVAQESKVSKARMIEHYQAMVQSDYLPSPINFVQLVLTAPLTVLVMLVSTKGWTKTSKAIKSLFGRVVFWLVLGPLAVTVGILLWFVSMFVTPRHVWFRDDKDTGCPSDNSVARGVLLKAWWQTMLFLWCLVGAPLYLFVLWLQAFARVLNPGFYQLTLEDMISKSYGGAPGTTGATIEKLLRKDPQGVGADKLREFLESPFDDKDVRRDEKGRNPTVEHIKLLRNRLERTTRDELQERFKQLEGKLETTIGGMFETFEKKLEDRFGRKFDELKTS